MTQEIESLRFQRMRVRDEIGPAAFGFRRSRQENTGVRVRGFCAWEKAVRRKKDFRSGGGLVVSTRSNQPLTPQNESTVPPPVTPRRPEPAGRFFWAAVLGAAVLGAAVLGALLFWVRELLLEA